MSISPAWSANININDLTDTIVISAADFELGFTGAGSFDETTSGPLSFSGSWIDRGLTPTGSRTIYLVEAGDPTVLSDTLHYSFSSDGAFGTITGTFTSDVEEVSLGTVPSGVAPGDLFVEDGSTVNFSLPFLTGQVNSDVDPAPEPASLWLFGTGLSGLLIGAKKFRNR